MDREENINDILELLKNMNKTPAESSASVVTDDDGNGDIEQNDLKELLKVKFMGDGSDTSESSESSEYKLDEGFFIEEVTPSDDNAENAALLLLDDNYIDPIKEPIEETAEETIEEPIEENVEETIEEPIEENVEETIDETIEEFSEKSITEQAQSEQAQEYFSGYSGQLSLFEDSERNDEYAEDAENISEDEHFDDSQITLDFGDTYDEGVELANGERSNIDTSFLGLMLEIGDNVAIGKNVSVERDDIYNDSVESDGLDDVEIDDAYGFDGSEYTSSEQADDIFYSYQRDKKFTFLRLLGSSAFAVLLFVFELLPVLSINLGGFFDYNKYPAVYLMTGAQLLVFCGAFAWRELFTGIKRAFCLRADVWSISSLITLAVIVYQSVLSILPLSHMPHSFCALAAIYIVAGLVYEYLTVKREIRTFEVYSCDSVKYTFETEPLANSAAEKMYRGGVSSDLNIYEPRQVKFPRGYFAEVNRRGEPDPFINGMITPIILASACFWIVSMLLEVSLISSLEIFMLSLASLCPISLLISKSLPMSIASSRLYERESAIASEASAKKYAACDIMIFRDSHLFRRSKSSENGIIIYDKNNTVKVIEYLNAIYTMIGGPMKELFSDAARKKYEPTFRRIARNGVEALINGESVILGDITFQQRYGIVFADTEEAKAGEGILCLSIGGRPAAKLCLKYATEPIFEMIASKMEESSIKCAIETYDPVINSAFVAASRQNGKAPINVVHKNVTDFYSEMPENVEGSTGLVACSSRLKLVECVIWCKKILALRKACSVIHIVTAVVTFALIAALLLVGGYNKVDQFAVLIWQAVCTLPALVATVKILPKKKYFAAGLEAANEEKTEISKDNE